jgi:hypothetical protein
MMIDWYMLIAGFPAICHEGTWDLHDVTTAGIHQLLHCM